MRSSVRCLRVILVLGAFLHLSGGHYGVLQCIAWSKMLIEYSSTDGLLEGAQKTFDGTNPCDMCRSIVSAKQVRCQHEEQAPAPGTEQLSLKDLRIPPTVSLDEPSSRDIATQRFAPPVAGTGLAGESPPFPPPRGV